MKIFLKFSRRCWPKSIHGLIAAGCQIPEIWFHEHCVAESNSDISKSESRLNCIQTVCFCTAFVTSTFYKNLENISEQELYNIVLGQLEEIFSHLEAKHMKVDLCGETEDFANLPQPSEVYLGGLVHKWNALAYPYIGGGYHSPKVGMPISYSAHLAEPINGKVFFCGEATNVKAGITVHAAMDTGKEAARHVNEAISSA